MTATTADKGKEINTYTGRLRSAIMITLMVIIVHIGAMGLLVNEITVVFWAVNIVLFILYMLFFAIMAFQATYIKISVYENGIEWQRSTSCVFTTWDNINKIDRKDEGDSTTFGIYLHEHVSSDVSSWLDRRFFSNPVDYIRLIPTVSVPTTFKGLEGNMIDIQAFAKTDFGQDLARYAPHLFGA
jgi:hypothetical protein